MLPAGGYNAPWKHSLTLGGFYHPPTPPTPLLLNVLKSFYEAKDLGICFKPDSLSGAWIGWIEEKSNFLSWWKWLCKAWYLPSGRATKWSCQLRAGGRVGSAGSSCLSGPSQKLSMDALISCRRNCWAHALPSPPTISAEAMKAERNCFQTADCAWCQKPAAQRGPSRHQHPGTSGINGLALPQEPCCSQLLQSSGTPFLAP